MRGGPPDKLKDRDYLLGYMLASGLPKVEIARRLDLTPTRVGMIAQSPHLRVLVRDIQRDLHGRALDELTGLLRREGQPTLRKLVSLRDGAEKEEVQLGAARELWGSLVPKRTAHEEDRTVRIAFDAMTLERMLAVREEMGEPPIEAEAIALGDGNGDGGEDTALLGPEPSMTVEAEVREMQAEVSRQRAACLAGVPDG